MCISFSTLFLLSAEWLCHLWGKNAERVTGSFVPPFFVSMLWQSSWSDNESDVKWCARKSGRALWDWKEYKPHPAWSRTMVVTSSPSHLNKQPRKVNPSWIISQQESWCGNARLQVGSVHARAVIFFRFHVFHKMFLFWNCSRYLQSDVDGKWTKIWFCWSTWIILMAITLASDSEKQIEFL